jgi:predicted MFS family arabinose efflux permease
MTSLDRENHYGADGERPNHHCAHQLVLEAGSVQIDIGGPPTGGDGVPAHRWRAFVLLAVAYFMTIVDLTIVNVALPTIGHKLHFSESNLQWVVTAYGLTFGGFLLLGGRAADMLGRRRLFMVGMTLFTAASFADALSTTDSFLIVMRGIQGLGAALVLPAA